MADQIPPSQDDILKQRIAELEAQVEQFRQKELEQLRSLVSQLIIERDNFRNEANRNAEVGRQIATTAQQNISLLQAELDTQRRLNADARRDSRSR